MFFIAFVSRTLLATVFAVAAIGKTGSRKSYTRFAESLADLTWVPRPLRRAVAPSIVLAEAAVVVLAVVPATAVIGLSLALLVLASFTFAIAHALHEGTALRCNCFGRDAGAMGLPHLLRNLLLFGAAVAGCVTAAIGPGSGSPQGTAAAFAGGVLIGGVITRWDDLVYVFTPTRPAEDH